MIVICPLLYVGWKVLKKTKIHNPADIDLQKNMDEVAEYEKTYVPSKPG